MVLILRHLHLELIHPTVTVLFVGCLNKPKRNNYTEHIYKLLIANANVHTQCLCKMYWSIEVVFSKVFVPGNQSLIYVFTVMSRQLQAHGYRKGKIGILIIYLRRSCARNSNRHRLKVAVPQDRNQDQENKLTFPDLWSVPMLLSGMWWKTDWKRNQKAELGIWMSFLHKQSTETVCVLAELIVLASFDSAVVKLCPGWTDSITSCKVSVLNFLNTMPWSCEHRHLCYNTTLCCGKGCFMNKWVLQVWMWLVSKLLLSNS